MRDSSTPGTAGDEAQEAQKDLTFAEVLGSVLAAGFGVQSKKNKVRDFSRGDFRLFLLVGLIMTTGFVLGVIGLVNLILYTAA